MTKITICNSCGDVCQDFAEVLGWWTSELKTPTVKRIDEHLHADICQDCLVNEFPKLILRTELSRELQIEQHQREYPGKSPLYALMATAPRLETVTCDLCHGSASQMFATVMRQIIDPKGVLKVAEVCPRCIKTYLEPRLNARTREFTS